MEISSLYQFIRDQSNAKNHRISTLCRVLKVNQASYYRWLPLKKSKHSLENEYLEKRISKIYFDEGVYGAGKIHFALKIELEKNERI